jgi:hypothetical protein
MIMTINECGIVGGMGIGRGNQRTWIKLALMSVCPPQISHNLTGDCTQVTGMGSE